MTTAKLTFSSAGQAGRWLGIELVGEHPDARITHRKFRTCVTSTLDDALAAYIQEWGLTLVTDVERVGTSLQVGVR
jgi:hypothetical protein